MSAIVVWLIATQDMSSFQGRTLVQTAAPVFIASTLASLAQVMRPTRLTLDGSGFTVSRLFGPPNEVRWVDTEPLFLWQTKDADWIARSGNMVVFRYLPGRRPAQHRVSKKAEQAGGDGHIPDIFNVAPGVLAERMNRLRAEAIALGGSATARS
ncbi:MAG TPA: hypothetical protein VF459_06235 [Caulobacteraceae bacterium]